MTAGTQVFALSAKQAEALESALRSQLPPESEWRQVPHARYSVKALGVVLTCYKSGKLVVQGSQHESFVAKFLSDASPSAKKQAKPDDPELTFENFSLGSDETGKGDYFGPLVVAACAASPDQREALEEIGVTDSKALSDARAQRMAGLIESAFDHAIVQLGPEEYNETHRSTGNVNVILAKMHAEALSQLARRNPETATIVVDRFTTTGSVAKAVQATGTSIEGIRWIEIPRAERHPVVAAASILARAAFLEGLAACSESCGSDLHKGAGAPVDTVAQRVFDVGGDALLGTVAKMHFKNTTKVRRNG